LFSKQDVTGFTCYVYPMPPCSHCAALLVQSGIKRIVTFVPTAEQAFRWKDSFEAASRMYEDAGVRIEYREVKHD